MAYRASNTEGEEINRADVKTQYTPRAFLVDSNIAEEANKR